MARKPSAAELEQRLRRRTQQQLKNAQRVVEVDIGEQGAEAGVRFGAQTDAGAEVMAKAAAGVVLPRPPAWLFEPKRNRRRKRGQPRKYDYEDIWQASYLPRYQGINGRRRLRRDFKIRSRQALNQILKTRPPAP